jgi:signal transduction histidine kinase
MWRLRRGGPSRASSGHFTTAMPKSSADDELARECVRTYAELRRATGVLHDDVGSLLAVAGLRLQLLSMDFPAASARVAEAAEALEGVMEHVRKLSRELEPSPVRRTGLKNALQDLAESFAESLATSGGAGVTVRYTATVNLAALAADAVYRAIASAVTAAWVAPGVTRIAISVSGSRSLTARVAHDGRQRYASRELAAAGLLARHSGLGFEIISRHNKTKRGTIVVIQYAGRRTAGG